MCTAGGYWNNLRRDSFLEARRAASATFFRNTWSIPLSADVWVECKLGMSPPIAVRKDMIFVRKNLQRGILKTAPHEIGAHVSAGYERSKSHGWRRARTVIDYERKEKDCSEQTSYKGDAFRFLYYTYFNSLAKCTGLARELVWAASYISFWRALFTMNKKNEMTIILSMMRLNQVLWITWQRLWEWW